MRLSILIPSIPSRFEKAITLYNRLLALIGDKDIEILMFTDNKKRSIGYKREALKNISQGKYFMFIDDDDDLVSVDKIYEATIKDVDVIDFNARCLNSDGSPYIVTQRLGNKIEHRSKNGRYKNMKRPPWMNCAWHNRFKQFSFPDINYSEDWEFIRQCLEVAKTEHFIDKVLFHYNFSPSETEASTESNDYWQNPNESNN